MPDIDDNAPRRTAWTNRDHLVFDIGYAFPRSGIRGVRRAFDEDDRRRIAQAIVEHLELCGWRFQRKAPSVWAWHRPRGMRANVRQIRDHDRP